MNPRQRMRFSNRKAVEWLLENGYDEKAGTWEQQQMRKRNKALKEQEELRREVEEMENNPVLEQLAAEPDSVK